MRTSFDSDSCLGSGHESFGFEPSYAGESGFDSEDDVRISLKKHMKTCKKSAKRSQFNRDHGISPSEACVSVGRIYVNIKKIPADMFTEAVMLDDHWYAEIEAVLSVAENER